MSVWKITYKYEFYLKITKLAFILWYKISDIYIFDIKYSFLIGNIWYTYIFGINIFDIKYRNIWQYMSKYVWKIYIWCKYIFNVKCMYLV